MSDQLLVAPRPVGTRPWKIAAAVREHDDLDPVATTFADIPRTTWTSPAMFTACGVDGVNGRPSIARPAPGLLGDVT